MPELVSATKPRCAAEPAVSRRRAGRRTGSSLAWAAAAAMLALGAAAGCAGSGAPSGGGDASFGFDRGAVVRGNRRYSVAYLPDQQAAIFRFTLVTSLSDGSEEPAAPDLAEAQAAAAAEAPDGCRLDALTERELGVYEAQYDCESASGESASGGSASGEAAPGDAANGSPD